MASLTASTRSHQPFHGYQEEDVQDGMNYEHGGQAEATIEGWRSIADAVRAATAMLSVESELDDVSAAEATVAAKENERRAITSKLSKEADALMKELKKARLDALRPQNQPTPEGHLAEVDRLEREYNSSGKQLSEAEASVSRKQSELGRMKIEKEEVGKMEVGDEGAWANGKVLRLKLLNEAGFTLIPGKGNSAPKVLIRDEAKSDIHTLSLDNSRSKTHNANFIWGLAGE